jgi:hypothetical protein
MKLLKIVVMVAVFMLFSSSSYAQAAPECASPTQATALDYSNGSGALCMPGNLADGVAIDAGKMMTCTVEFFDGAGNSLGSESFSGGPSSLHTFSVPRDGIGSAVAGCTLDALVSANATTAITFPVSSVPNPPVIMP